MISDDESWVGLNVDSKNSTVCSYKFQNENSISNYEKKFNNNNWNIPNQIK